MDTKLPPMVMPWMRPIPDSVPYNQDRAAYMHRLLDHHENLDVDSVRSPAILTTIISTVGIQTTEDDIVSLLEAGTRVLRIDTSHLNTDWYIDLVARARRAITRFSDIKHMVWPTAVAFDLKGPFILTGKIKSGVSVYLKAGNSVRVTTHPAYEEHVTEEVVFVDHRTLHQIAKPKMKMFLDNGRIELAIRGVVDCDIICEVITGGELGNHRRVQLPGAALDMPDLTSKDWEDIYLALKEKIDAIFLPYSVDWETMKKIKEVLGETGKRITLFTKIETRSCYDRINEIISYSDGVVINRGSLSVEMSTEKVIQAQKTIAAKCNKAAVIVYAMTDFLASMKHLDCPTIAEVTDVNATIQDGVDGLIIGEEISQGDNPNMVVRTLAVLCREAESEIWQLEVFKSFQMMARPPIDPVQAICMAAVETSMKANVSAILVCSTSGTSAKTLAQYRPRCPIIACTRYGGVARSLSLYRGLWPVHYIHPPHPCWPKDVDRRLHCASEHAKAEGLIKPGDLLLLISSWRQGAGYTNQLRIVYASPKSDTWILPKTASLPQKEMGGDLQPSDLMDKRKSSVDQTFNRVSKEQWSTKDKKTSKMSHEDNSKTSVGKNQGDYAEPV